MFAGLISKEQAATAWGDATKIMAALAPYSLDKPREYWATNKHMLVQVATRNDAVTAKIYQHLESGVAVAFWGRLDNRADLIAQLEAEQKASDDELIALAWLKWSEYCPEKLIGDFAFAVVSPRTGLVFLARDVMGVKPLFYRADQHGVFFANSVAAFKPLQLGTLTRCQEWMARFMVDVSMSHTTTAYKEIVKLPGAHCLLIHADGRLNLRRYHQFVDDAPTEKTRDPKYLEAYRAIWQEAVACRIPTTGNIGTENSGGLDSGSITAEIAKQLSDDKDRLYGMGFCYEPLEPEYIMATAMQWHLNNNLLCSGGSDKRDEIFLKEILISGYPHEHGNGSSHKVFYEWCKQNQITVLNSGFGGDEVVTASAGMLRAELWDRKLWRNLWEVMPGNLLFKAGRVGKTALNAIKKPQSNDPTLLKHFKERWKFRYIRDDVASHLNLQSDYFASATYNENYRNVNAFSMDRMQMPFVPTRLENCTLMASSYGIEYVWPLWDQRLVQQWLSTPSIWKVGDKGVTRYLHRQAILGVCPEIVAMKPTKEMGNMRKNLGLDTDALQSSFQQLSILIENIHTSLLDMIDVEKLRELAVNGMNNDLNNTALLDALCINNQKLECLNIFQTQNHC